MVPVMGRPARLVVLLALVLALALPTSSGAITAIVKRNLLCIHRYEGSWTANTGNGYYGGLQMDRSFQKAHGLVFYRRWGTANHWPIWAQLQAGANAVRTRGYGPWPNTRRICRI